MDEYDSEEQEKHDEGHHDPHEENEHNKESKNTETDPANTVKRKAGAEVASRTKNKQKEYKTKGIT